MLESLTPETCCAQFKFERQDTGFCGVPVKDSHPPLRGGSSSCPGTKPRSGFVSEARNRETGDIKG